MTRRFRKAALIVAATMVLSLRLAASFPIYGQQTALPEGSDLNEQALDVPREIFRSESAGGRKSYLVNLGDLAFNSPSLLGGGARQAGMSCGTCHVNGASNPKFYIPHLSTRPGNVDTTSSLFNPHADNGVLDPARIPSLRGAHLLGPYGIDGRTASLRDFVRTVIVGGFAGPEPSAALLDALVAYIQDIDFLRNLSLGPAGRLTARSSDAERRGEVLFVKPFPHDPTMSCATCHVPSAAFVDHRPHDVGSGGLFKTPTLLNADFNAPYFHDGRFDTYDQIVGYFDQAFELGLTGQDRADLVAYLAAVGDGMRPQYALSGPSVLSDINDFASILDIAISRHDSDIVAVAVPSLTGLLQDLAAHYPQATVDAGTPGTNELSLARATLAALVQTLHRVEQDAAAGHFDQAANEYLGYRKLTLATAQLALQAAQPWSLYDPTVHAAQHGNRSSP